MPRIVAVLSLCLLFETQAWADTWCHSNFPDALFCDDFDTYCDPPPTFPDACAADAADDADAMRQVWVPGVCGTNFRFNPGPDATRIASSPFGARNLVQPASELGQQTVDLVDEIQARFGPEFSAVMGTDANPLVLRFTFSGGVSGSFHAPVDHGFMELSLDDDFAPMDYVLHPDCSVYCPNGDGPPRMYPIVCAQNAPHPSCPPAGSLPIRASIAVGLVPTLDNNPCHCETPASQRPQNSHLNIFDGRRWWRLDNNVFPGSGSFTVGDKYNTVILTIRSEDMVVEHLDKNGGQLGIATVPRQYLGGFNKLRGGTSRGCQLVADSSTYECDSSVNGGERSCLIVNGGGANVVYDNIMVQGGQGMTQAGSCCLPDATCQEGILPEECSALGGTFNGAGTTCQTALCCATPSVDGDGDGDVDVDDFGDFQRCYTGSATGLSQHCKCFDANGDNRIDQDDFTAFVNCVSGPSVPWSTEIAPNCVP